MNQLILCSRPMKKGQRGSLVMNERHMPRSRSDVLAAAAEDRKRACTSRKQSQWCQRTSQVNVVLTAVGFSMMCDGTCMICTEFMNGAHMVVRARLTALVFTSIQEG